MRIILLPGNKKTNNQWIKKFKYYFNDEFKEIISIDYTNFNLTGDFKGDIIKELEKITKLIENEKNYIIIAKTSGILLALYGIYHKKINPSYCIFMGIPIIRSRINNYKIDQWLKNYKIPTLIIQKEEDPDMIYDELKEYLNRLNKNNYIIKKIPGNDFYYENIESIKPVILNYLKNNHIKYKKH